MIQEPAPGQHVLHFRGDQVVFRLHLDAALTGNAYVRTNVGQARISRREIIRSVEMNEAPLGRDWFDIPMRPSSPGRYEAVLPLNEVGHFEAKCFFLPKGRSEPLWPEGPNSAINVEPADTICGNIVYNAFVRQFGPHKSSARSDYSSTAECTKKLDASGYTVIPPSGTFRALIAELDFIFDRMGCRVLQLLPIHPTPTTFARMGRFGSPYAALSFTAVDPALAVFDPKATPLDQFIELVDAVHARSGKIVIDMAINHTGWAASLHETHPQWLARKENGEIENPGAWGVIWADLTRLDYEHKDLWLYMADVFLTWCRRGVDGFRCDAAYMIPAPAWQYIIAKVRDEFPDTIFLLEGLGGKISVTRELLSQDNFNWAYSELFQNYDRSQIEWYLPEPIDISTTDGLTIHFAETHDNNRLAAVSATYARMRTALCALLAPNGAFGFTNGVEWLATEKINVHEAGALNWGAADNQVDAITRLNLLLKTHPAFGPSVRMTIISQGEGDFVAVARRHRSSGRGVLVIANLDCEQPVTAGWDGRQSDFLASAVIDLVSNTTMHVAFGKADHRVALTPGQVVCLADANDPWISEEVPLKGAPPLVNRQRLQAKALEVTTSFRIGETADPDRAALALRADPESFCADLNGSGHAPRVVFWHYPEDLRRDVMVPPGHMLLLRAPNPFRARIVYKDRVLAIEESLNDDSGRAFILFAPLQDTERHLFLDLETTLFDAQAIRHGKSRLLCLADGRQTRVQTSFSRNDCHRLPLLVLGTNGRGAMMRAHANGRLSSRYDALLAANLNPDYPEDRHIMLARFRGWVVYQGFSREIKLDCLEQFSFDYNEGGLWRYYIPAGQGEHIVLQLRAVMSKKYANAVLLRIERLHRLTGLAELADDQPVTLIVRPDIEDRNFHHTTKAFAGPEEQWPEAVAPAGDGFRFAPAGDRALVMKTDHGRFTAEPEWYYMVHRALEAERGLDPDSDLYSPGYFACQLFGGQSMTLTAQVIGTGAADTIAAEGLDRPFPEVDLPLETALSAALDQYVVRRGEFHTVIAGFPWFLDWGRDTLIVVRGLIAAGRLETAHAILLQFAQFEDHGTLPNMIRGSDAGDRDTSDAPLWFFTACADVVAAEGNEGFLSRTCNGRTIRQVLIDIAQSLVAGTPNGIVMDAASGLIFSPAHFTWMDTNYPAGTPRQGYPIEIQALWYAALRFLARIDKAGKRPWKALADQVKVAMLDLFWLEEEGYLSDIRHALPGQPAKQGRPDDALRPNQLLALTLGAVDDPAISRRILFACQKLLVPGAIRSLADQPAKMPLEVRRDGRLLNDPVHPFWGRYLGDEDTRRKPAYHNGTAWTWLFPSFCEAWAVGHGSDGRDAALAWLSSSILLIDNHCVGHVPEILDGHAPHHQRGCDAQAWGVSELLRVWKKLVC